MKRIVQSVAVAAVALSLFSCNDKLNIAAPYKNITVVYGLLNMGDTAHYVRIQKAFMDENQSAIDMAKVADSSFYQALDVKVKELSSAGTLISTTTLSRVDLKNEGFPKDSGAFFNTPSYAYKFKLSLKPENTYRIIITNTNTGNVDSSQTNIINAVGNNTVFGLAEWNPGFQFSFANEYLESGKLRSLEYSARIPASTVGVAQLVVRFNWTDSNTATGTSVRKSADYLGFTFKTASVGEQNPLQGSFDITSPNRNIYDFIRDAVGINSAANQYRYFDSCDMFLHVAGTEYRRYKDLNADNGGITADEIKPQYTNIRGNNVMGLFSTRATASKLQIPISKATRDSVAANPRTRDLNIRFYP